MARSEVTTGDITTHPRRRLATLSPNVLRRFHLKRCEVDVGSICGVGLIFGVGLVFGVVKSASIPSSASGYPRWFRLWRCDVIVDLVFGVVKSASIPSSVSRCRCQFGSILVSDDPIGRVRVGEYSEGFFPEEVRRGFPRRGITKGRSWRRRVKKRR